MEILQAPCGTLVKKYGFGEILVPFYCSNRSIFRPVYFFNILCNGGAVLGVGFYRGVVDVLCFLQKTSSGAPDAGALLPLCSFSDLLGFWYFKRYHHADSFLGVITFCVYQMVFERKMTLFYFALLFVSFYVIYSVKKYILISLIAGIIAWVSSAFFFNLKSIGLRIVLMPLVLIFCLAMTYSSVRKVMEDDAKYSIDRIAKTSMVTAYDIRYGWGARSGDGSGYTLGKLDGTWQNMLAPAPAALHVSLFRPYVWEVKSPLMVLSAFEAMLNLFFTAFVLMKIRGKIIGYVKAEVIFCLVFALIFAFGVGISSYNFGTLSRYKIPLLPFYWSALAIIYSSWRQRKEIIQEQENHEPVSKEI